MRRILLILWLSTVSVVGAMAQIANGFCGGEGDGTNLTWVLDENGTLTISGSGVMGDYNYYRDDQPWYTYRAQIKEIRINDGVKSIGDGAFYDFNSITSVVLPQGLERIGEDAFFDCTNLNTINLPEGLTELGSGVFKMCENLTEIVVPEGIAEIPYYAFYNCSSLTTITFPSTLKSIEDKAFNGCNFKSIVSLATVPAVCPDESYIYDLLFEFRTYNHAPLYIPEGKYWDYAFAPGWGEFIHIKEIAMDDSELEDSKAYMIADTKGCNYTVYNAEKGTLTNVEYTHSLDEENEGSCWTVLREAGKSYLYNLGAKKFACMDKEGELSLAEAPVALDITSTENGLSINGNNRMFVLNKNINVDATGIEDIRIDNAQTEGVDIYYLDGRRMNKSVRGVNIVNGRKVVVK